MGNRTSDNDKYIEFLDRAIKAKGYKSRRKFAITTGIPQTTVQHIFKNRGFLTANINTLITFCRVLEISPNFILMDENGVIPDISGEAQSQVSTPSEIPSLTVHEAKERELLARELALLEREEAVLHKSRELVLRQLNDSN